MLSQKLWQYVERFNADDDQRQINSIDNAHAIDWLTENIPLIDCPEKALEEMREKDEI